jgi:hypothetical protein
MHWDGLDARLAKRYCSPSLSAELRQCRRQPMQISERTRSLTRAYISDFSLHSGRVSMTWRGSKPGQDTADGWCP